MWNIRASPLVYKLTFGIELAFALIPRVVLFAHELYGDDDDDDYRIVFRLPQSGETTHICNVGMQAPTTGTPLALVIIMIILLFSFDSIVFNSNDDRISVKFLCANEVWRKIDILRSAKSE